MSARKDSNLHPLVLPVKPLAQLPKNITQLGKHSPAYVLEVQLHVGVPTNLLSQPVFVSLYFGLVDSLDGFGPPTPALQAQRSTSELQTIPFRGRSRSRTCV